VRNPTTPQPEGSMRIGEIDAIRQPGATHCRGEVASLSWAYGMPLSYVQEMANHWLGLYDHTHDSQVPAAQPTAVAMGQAETTSEG